MTVNLFFIPFNMEQSQKLKWFMHTALAYLGTPYRWGGDDPSGFDCSGFVIECLKTVGLCKENEDFTANSLLQHFSEKQAIQKPEKGALLFYCSSSGRAYHVVICLNQFYQIGASGGNNETTKSQKAWEQNAYIKIRPIPKMSSKIKIVSVLN